MRVVKAMGGSAEQVPPCAGGTRPRRRHSLESTEWLPPGKADARVAAEGGSGAEGEDAHEQEAKRHVHELNHALRDRRKAIEERLELTRPRKKEATDPRHPVV